jgi:polysaccharide chain length determinant protein (PEP-CTERM system associated)
MEDTHVHALDYVHVFRRRKWWLAVPIALSIVIGILLAMFLPKEYRSSATLAVSAPAVSNLVSPSTGLDNQERLRALTQQLVSQPILARVVKEEGLLAGAHPEDAVTRLRDTIKIEVPDPVATTSEPRRLDAFIVSYTDGDPVRAQRVANRIVTVFVDENSRARAARAEDTSTFIASQLEQSHSRLAELEAALRRAKEAHMGRLPEQTQANLQTLSGLRQQLEANATALRGEQDRLSMIERQLESMKQGTADLLIRPRSGGEPVAVQPETRVLMLQRELAEARTMYTSRHPEVQRLEEELSAARREAAPGSQSEVERLGQLRLDPAYQQLAGDQEIGRLRVRDLQRAEVDIRRQITIYQARVEGAPRVEQQLAAVTRDYALEKENYSHLSEKLQAAAMDENLQRNRRGEHFTVLYGANLPTKPIKPVPWRVMLISVVAGLCLGAAATLGREYLDRSVHDARDFKEAFDLPVLGEVARIQPV